MGNAGVHQSIVNWLTPKQTTVCDWQYMTVYLKWWSAVLESLKERF